MKFNFNELSIYHNINNMTNSNNNGNVQEISDTKGTNLTEDELNKLIDIIVDNQYQGINVNTIDRAYIPNYMFIANTVITEMNLFHTMSIGIGSFEFCENLQFIGNKDSELIIDLSFSSFANCFSLHTIAFKCNNLPDRCFYNCENLRQITLTSNVDNIGVESCCNCTELKQVETSNNIKSIGIRAFHNCLSLRQFNFSVGLELIDTLAFSHCNLTNITIPKSVKYIETEAFSNNIGLQKVVFEHSDIDVIYLNDNVFKNCPNVIIFTNNNIIKQYAIKNNIKVKPIST